MSLPLILLPGMMCDARLFASQVAVLGAERKVQVLPTNAHDTMAALAKAVLRAAPERFALGGLSMGGILAMEVLRQAPDRVARLALMDTNPLAEAPEVRARRGPQMEAVRAGGLARVMAEEMKPNYLAPGPRREDILTLCMEMAMTLGPEVFVRQSMALRDRPDQTETLRNCRCPTLILCGAEDYLCPPSRHELMHLSIPGSTLQIIPDAGHLPTLERPKSVTDALRHWLGSPATSN